MFDNLVFGATSFARNVSHRLIGLGPKSLAAILACCHQRLRCPPVSIGAGRAPASLRLARYYFAPLTLSVAVGVGSENTAVLDVSEIPDVSSFSGTSASTKARESSACGARK
jgi:hypothetical protein